MDDWSWVCSVCTLSNERDSTSCEACGTPREGHQQQEVNAHQPTSKPDNAFSCPYPYCSIVFKTVKLLDEHLILHQQMERDEAKKKEYMEEGYTGQYERTVLQFYERKRMNKKAMKKFVDYIRSNNFNHRDIETRTTGIMHQLKSFYGHIKGLEVRLCSDVDHYSTGFGDAGWGCGYRNLQMVLSYLMKFSPLKKGLFQGCGYVPTIPCLQGWLEKAWKAGIDKEGAKQLNNHVYNTKQFIGTSEIVALLKLFKIKCKILDFFFSKRT